MKVNRKVKINLKIIIQNLGIEQRDVAASIPISAPVLSIFLNRDGAGMKNENWQKLIQILEQKIGEVSLLSLKEELSNMMQTILSEITKSEELEEIVEELDTSELGRDLESILAVCLPSTQYNNLRKKAEQNNQEIISILPVLLFKAGIELD